MRSFEIFQQISPELANRIFHDLRTEEKDVYTTALSSLAAQRKLRPVFIQKKRPEEQYAWLHKMAKLKLADGIDEHLLQIWLMKAREEMLVIFLDLMAIDHDGEGAVEDLPETLDAEKLPGAIEKLLGKFDAEEVAVYLHVFQMQRPGGWDELSAELEKNDKLSLPGGE